MNHERTTRHRATVVRPGDRRAAGYYEQCADDPSGVGDPDLHVLLGGLTGIEVSGMVDRPGRLTITDLRGLAAGDCVSGLSAQRIDVAAVLRHVRLFADAEIVLVGSGSGGPLAFRIDAMLKDSSMHLEIGVGRSDGCIDWRAPIMLHGASVPGGAVVVRSIRATTFVDFVSGAP